MLKRWNTSLKRELSHQHIGNIKLFNFQNDGNSVTGEIVKNLMGSATLKIQSKIVFHDIFRTLEAQASI